MKKLLFLFILISSTLANAQFLEDGEYQYYNEELTLTLRICESGEIVCYFELEDGPHVAAYDGRGEWFRVNMNGVDEGYSGPEGWYQIEVNSIIYEIEYVSESKVKLIGFSDEAIIFER